jgi:transketolase
VHFDSSSTHARVDKVAKSEALAKAARKSIVGMTHKAKAAHTGSSLSVVDILSVLYLRAFENNTLSSHSRDNVVVSKGHASAAVYSVLAHVGYFPVNWLDSFCLDGSRLGGHVNHYEVPGVDLSTGSLGHGLPFAAGKALASKLSGTGGAFFVVLSDGECGEGSVWESALFANQHKLGNLVVLIDRNRLQSLKSTEETLALDPLDKKWEAFGWEVCTVNGHDHEALWEVIEDLCSNPNGGPKLIVCETTKGFGVSFMENSVLWHYKSPSDSELKESLAEIESRF